MIVNCFAGAGSGKTACAWHIASELKKRHILTEYVPEYAKELVWDERYDLLDGGYKNQMHIMQEQKRRLDRLLGKVQVVVTDSPLLLSVVYVKERQAEIERIIIGHHHSYNNFNLFINRGKRYEQQGRIHTLEQSREIDKSILDLLNKHNLYFGTYYHKTVPIITDNIVKRLQNLGEAVEPTEHNRIMLGM